MVVFNRTKNIIATIIAIIMMFSFTVIFAVAESADIETDSVNGSENDSSTEILYDGDDDNTTYYDNDMDDSKDSSIDDNEDGNIDDNIDDSIDYNKDSHEDSHEDSHDDGHEDGNDENEHNDDHNTQSDVGICELDCDCDYDCDEDIIVPEEMGVTFDFDTLYITMEEFHSTDIDELLLRGVMALDENENDISHFVTVNDYSLFEKDFFEAEYAFEGQVTYTINALANDDELESNTELISQPRDVKVLFMSIQPTSVSIVTTVAELRQALSANPGALNGAVIQLGANIPEINDAPNGAGLFIGRNVTLDLNGFTLSIQLPREVGTTSNCIKIGSGVTFTVMCSTSSHPSGIDGIGFLHVRNPAIVIAANPILPGFGAGINTTDGTLIIQSGRVSAFGSGDFQGTAGASIGGGHARNGGTVIINGGDVRAQTAGFAAGIGGGDGGSGGNITINGGMVTASGGSTGSGIGGGRNGGAGNITINNVSLLTARSGTVNTNPGRAIGPGGGSTDFGTIRVSGNYNYSWSLHSTFNPEGSMPVSWNNTSNPFGNNRFVELNTGLAFPVTLHFTGLIHSDYDGVQTYEWGIPMSTSININIDNFDIDLPMFYTVVTWFTNPELTIPWNGVTRVANLYAFDNVVYDNDSAVRVQARSNEFPGIGAGRIRNILVGASFTLEQTLIINAAGTTPARDSTYHNLTDTEKTISVDGNFRHFTVNNNGVLNFSENLNTVFTRSAVLVADETNGGGVHINNGGTLNMNGGTISRNRAENGGGVCVEGINARFTMTGGTISNNHATNDGGGVFITHFPNTAADTARINIGTGAVFTGNTAGRGSFRLSDFADDAEYTPHMGRMITAVNLRALHAGHTVPTLPGPIFFASPSPAANSMFLVNNFDVNFVGRDEDMVVPKPAFIPPSSMDYGEVYLIPGLRYRLNGTATTDADAGLGAGIVTDMSGVAGNFEMINPELLSPDWSLTLICTPFMSDDVEGARAIAIRNSDRDLRLPDSSTGVLNAGTVYDAQRRAQLSKSYSADFNWNDLIFDVLAEITYTGNPGAAGTKFQSTFTWIVNNIP